MEVRAGLGVVTAGVLVGELVASVWAPPAALLPLALCASLVCWRRRRLAVWSAVVLAALAVGAARMRTVVRPTLPLDHVARLALPMRTTLRGVVVAAPERRDGRVLLLVAAEAVGRGGARRPVSGLVRLTIRRPARRWRYGDRLEASATLRRPRSFHNPGSFDWSGHLARRGVLVAAFVWDGAAVARLPGRARGARAELERWRARLGRAIVAAVPGREGAVLRALVIGEQDGIDAAVREPFTRAGVVHVLSISGLHVGLVAAGAFAVARWLLARSERLLLRVDVRCLATAVALAPVALYAALAGLGVATLRAAIMVAAVVVASLLGRRADVLRTLAIAALALALAWPGAPLDIPFQLSFASVLAIVCGTRRLAGPTVPPGWRARLRAALVASPCAVVGTAPLTAFHFHQVSLVAPLANPIAIPLFGGLAVGLGLAGAALEPVAPSLAATVFRAAGLVLRPGIGLVDVLARPAWAALEVPIPTLFELTLCYVGLGGLVCLRGRVARVVVALALVGLVADVAWWTHERLVRRTLRVTFLDVGQGDAAVAELPGGEVLVVDAGGFPGSDFDTGAAVVAPFLLARKIVAIDALAMTHTDADHAGGLPYLLLRHRPRVFWWTGIAGPGREWARLRDALARSRTPLRVLTAGGTAPPSDTRLEVLNPPADATFTAVNDSSLTLRLRLGALAVLLTGDIEARAEEGLLAAPERLRAAVLKVPHHGSRTSSTPAFVDAVAPQIAVMSVGEGNRYRLPSPEVEARYRERGACVLRTDRCGAVTVETDGETLAVWTALGCECG